MINRRQFLLDAAIIARGSFGSSWRTSKPSADIHPSYVRTANLARFEDLKVGVSFHFGISTFTGHDYDLGLSPASLYAPHDLNTDQWIASAAQIGAKYAVLTAKHMLGFCLWPARDYDYSVTQSGNPTDVVKEFLRSCKKYGMMGGLYYCILDPRNEGNQTNSGWGKPVSNSYFNLIQRQIAELHTRYKGVGLQFIDIPSKLTPEQRWILYRSVKRLNPNCLLMYNQGWPESQKHHGDRCTANAWPTDLVDAEDALPPESGHVSLMTYDSTSYYIPMVSWLPSGSFYVPDPATFKPNAQTHIRNWFWNQGYTTRPPEELFELYRDTFSRNASLCLNLAPDIRGRLPDEAVATLNKVGQLIASHQGA